MRVLRIRNELKGRIWTVPDAEKVLLCTVPDNDLLTAGAEERVCGAAAPQPVRRGVKPEQRILSFNPSSLVIKGGAMVSDNWTLDRSCTLVCSVPAISHCLTEVNLLGPCRGAV
jgi:hypothetical protein